MLIIGLFLSLSVLFTIERYELVLERIDDNLLLQLGLDDKTNIINEGAEDLRILDEYPNIMLRSGVSA